jgi:sugar transferase (PEP-CTERM system associated)
MTAVLLQCNRRTLGVVAVQGACAALAIGLAELARAHGAGPLLTGDAAVLPIAIALAVAAAWGTRAVLARLLDWAGPRERLLVIGTTEASVTFSRELSARRSQLGVDVVGFVGLDRMPPAQAALATGVLGDIGDLPDLVRRRRVDRVVIDLAEARGRLPVDALLDVRLRGVPVDHLASAYERYTGKIALAALRPSWLIFSPGFRQTRLRAAAKRAFDVGAAGIGLLFALPLAAIVAVAVKLTSPGPVFYSQRRVGQNGRVFTIHKFRSMRVDAELTTGAVWAAPNDSRLTPIGQFLRSTRLDELPQLWNVLRNDMSLVGPRPERPEFVSRLERDISFYSQRHLVKPGLTGWAQISYPYGASVDDALQKLQYDLYYLKHMSFVFDVFILVATLRTVWLRSGR